MLFTSYEFIAFLLVMFLLYYLVPKEIPVDAAAGGQLCVLRPGPASTFLAYILATTVTTWLAARQITRLQEQQSAWLKAHKAELSREERKAYKAAGKKKTRRFFLACLLLNLGILAVIKYTDFFISNINGNFWHGPGIYALCPPHGNFFLYVPEHGIFD